MAQELSKRFQTALVVSMAGQRRPVERRNLAARQALLTRISAEFEELKGMSLTLSQAAKLLGISHDACARILVQLLDAGLLHLRGDGRFVLRRTFEFERKCG